MTMNGLNGLPKKDEENVFVFPDLDKQSISESKPCPHCGSHPQEPPKMHMIWPPPRPVNHIHQDSTKFIGYILLIAVVVFLVFAACKYLPDVSKDKHSNSD